MEVLFSEADVNGKKGRNQWGRDGFMLNIAPDGSLLPWRGQQASIGTGYFTEDEIKERAMDCNETSSINHGQTCAARIMEVDNWQMKY